jgi:hypothetical protein
MSMEAALDEKIREVCPIDGISFGDLKKKETWKIDFLPNATLEQKLAAAKVLKEFEWDEKSDKEMEDKLRIETLKQNPAMKGCYFLYLDKVPKATFEEYVAYLDGLSI